MEHAIELASLPLSAWIEVTGEDAPHFLQSQFSNDLRAGVGAATPGLWLDHRARLHGESIVLQVGEERFWIVSHSTPAAGLRAKLESHVIADEVFFDDRTAEVSGLCMIGAHGDEAALAAVLGELPASGRFTYQEDQYIARVGFPWGETMVVVGPVASVAQTRAGLLAAGVRASGPDESEWRRILRRQPRIPAEVGLEETPSEAGLAGLCSLQKGCYLGQEVVNRQVRLERSARRLVVVEFSRPFASPPVLPLGLLDPEGREVGSLRSVMTFQDRTVGLAMVKTRALSGPVAAAGEDGPGGRILE